nr:PREDICTED: uncharacterized protein LOC109037305 [Bemisia tabaci]
MFVSRIFVFSVLLVVFSCISSIHGWLFYKKSYYPYATREYNANQAQASQGQGQSGAQPQQTPPQGAHHPVPVATPNNWMPMLHSGVFYNDAAPGQGVPVTVAIPVAVPAAVLKDNIPPNMYMGNTHPGSVQSVPLYVQDRPQGLQMSHPNLIGAPQDGGMKYSYGPCMCPVSYSTKVEADQPQPPSTPEQPTQPATPTRETYVVQPVGTTTA